MFPLPPLQLSAGGGGPSGATAANGISYPNQFAFNFDNSGWVITQKSSGVTATATGNKDANQQSQTVPTMGGSSMPPNMLLLAGAAVLLVLLSRHQ